MIPSFLEAFKTEIEKQKLETVKILTKPLDKGEALPIKQSKFLGKPFLPLDIEYPKDKNKVPMIMLAQINFNEVPALENYPTEGILQLFVSPTDWYDMNDYKILFHPNINQDYQTDFSFLTEELYAESAVYCEHKLTFQKRVEYGGPTDFRFQLTFGENDYYDYWESLPKEQQDEFENFFDSAGHKIGGYAYFTQSDPRDYDDKLTNDILLLQIDSDDEIMFGDRGVANLFINTEDLKNKNFEKAYFNWDCC